MCASVAIHPASGGQQPWQPDEIARRHGHRELRADPFGAAMDGLCHAAHGLAPVERFLDLLPAALRQGLARMAGGAAIDGGILGLLRDVRCHAHLPQVGDEVGAVISLVRAQRLAAGRTRGLPVEHVQRGRSFGMATARGSWCSVCGEDSTGSAATG